VTIFEKTWRQVLDGAKRNSRRVVIGKGYIAESENGFSYWLDRPAHRESLIQNETPIVAIYTAKNDKLRLLYRAGKDYAVCPGRGKWQVGRYKLLSIRLEYVQDISEGDVIKEGIQTVYDFDGHSRGSLWATFGALWKSLHKKSPNRWEDNPPVLVMGIEVKR